MMMHNFEQRISFFYVITLLYFIRLHLYCFIDKPSESVFIINFYFSLKIRESSNKGTVTIEVQNEAEPNIDSAYALKEEYYEQYYQG